MAGLSRTKAAAGGLSVPIGSGVTLLDAENTVTRSGETFLKNGQLSNAATYPNAPVRNFFGDGSITGKTLGPEVSPLGSDTSPDGSYYGQSATANSRNVADNQSATSYSENFWWINWEGSNLYVYRFTNMTSATPLYVNRKLVNDGTILPTGGGWTSGASLMQAQGWGGTYRPGSSTYSSSQRGNDPTVGVDRIGVCIYAGSSFRCAILSADLATHVMTLIFTPKAAWYGTQYMRLYYQNTGSADNALSADKYTVVWMNSSQKPTFTRYNAPTSTQVSNGGDQTLTYAKEFHANYSTYAPHFSTYPEIWPYYTGTWETSISYSGYIGLRGTASSVASNAQRIHYYDVGGNHAEGANVNPSESVAYNASIPANVWGGYNSPIASRLAHFNKPANSNFVPMAAICKVNQAQIQVFPYDDLTPVTNTLPAAFNTSNYTGYVSTSSTNIYFGHTDGGKAYSINPTNSALGTAITLSGQAAPYRFTWYNNVLYNLNGTNIHSYNTTNGAFVATVAISDEFSGTNATGIANDGTHIYVVDKSNSRVYKYTISNMAATPTYVTLSDNPHTLTGTIDGMAVDSGKIYINRNSQLFVYNLADGTYGNAFKSSMGSGDVDVHDSNIVVATGTIVQTPATIQLDKVGHPTDGTGEITSNYTRVA